VKVVIQCAASKASDAGVMQTADGRAVVFVADPAGAPVQGDVIHARPDDLADDGRSWRAHLLAYNKQPGANPLGLLPAWRLYRHGAYGSLVSRHGVSNVFILSAGWGLIRADFLTPSYDITFSAQADPFNRRRATDAYADFNMLDTGNSGPVVFFGGKDYLPLFARLTEGYAGPRVAVFSSASEPRSHGVRLVRYHTTTRTNWHYGAVKAFLDGRLVVA
jgi:hypothetical protein